MENKNMEIMAFENETFGTVRTITRDGEPWFVAADVCKALEIKNTGDVVTKLDDDEKMTIGLTDSHSGQRGGAQMVNIINEPGLYTLVLRSRKPEAKVFKRWITHEVIPCIRKHGGYMTKNLVEQIMQEPEVIYIFAEKLSREHQQNLALKAELVDARPKADYFDAFVNPGDCTNIRATAKELGIPERKFCQFLLDAKIMYRCPAGVLMPYNKPKNAGLFIVRDYCRNGHKGSYALFTPKGKDLIRQLTAHLAA